MKLTNGLRAAWDAYQQASELRRSVRKMVAPNASADIKGALATLEAAIDSVTGDTLAARNFSLAGGPAPAPRFVDVSVALVSQLKAQDYADQAPTPAMVAGWTKSCEALGTALRTWRRVVERDVAAFSETLQRNQIANVIATTRSNPAVACGP
jgi:hypothetical protein